MTPNTETLYTLGWLDLSQVSSFLASPSDEDWHAWQATCLIKHYQMIEQIVDSQPSEEKVAMLSEVKH